jgi:hypothetical protein
MKTLSIVWLLLAALVSVSIWGCEKGMYTKDRHYIGNPERPAATSEPATVPGAVSPSGARGTPHADPYQ